MLRIGKEYHKGLPSYYSHIVVPVKVSITWGKHCSINLSEGEGNSMVGGSFTAQKLFSEMNRHQTHFQLAKAEWFIPYIERMANGEDVKLEEIKQAYRDNNDGCEIEEFT